MLASSRWFASLVLAAGIGAASLVPATARASDDLVRIIVDVADVVLHGGSPYYRHGSYGPHDRLIVVHDRHGRPTYYRQAPRHHRAVYRHPSQFRGPPPHARARGHIDQRNASCDRRGRCTVRYYDPRHDRDHRGNRHHHHARRDGRRR